MPQFHAQVDAGIGSVQGNILMKRTVIQPDLAGTVNAEERLFQFFMGMFTADGFLVQEVVNIIDPFNGKGDMFKIFRHRYAAVDAVIDAGQRY